MMTRWGENDEKVVEGGEMVLSPLDRQLSASKASGGDVGGLRGPHQVLASVRMIHPWPAGVNHDGVRGWDGGRLDRIQKDEGKEAKDRTGRRNQRNNKAAPSEGIRPWAQHEQPGVDRGPRTRQEESG